MLASPLLDRVGVSGRKSWSVAGPAMAAFGVITLLRASRVETWPYGHVRVQPLSVNYASRALSTQLPVLQEDAFFLSRPSPAIHLPSPFRHSRVDSALAKYGRLKLLLLVVFGVCVIRLDDWFRTGPLRCVCTSCGG